MPTTTDLRAALRDAAKLLDSYSEIGFTSERAAARAMSARLVALADAPPTVAELLPRVDATHEVRWQCSIEAKAECRAVYADGNIAIQWRHPGGRWRSQEMTAADLIQPGRLVEVTP